MMTTFARSLIGLALAILVCDAALAQRMYRCGNQYQEFPCAAGQGKVVNTSGAGKSAAASTTSDAECAARGAGSQKIMWAREAGATQDKQVADLNAKGQADVAQIKLIAAVYAKRGTAPEVRAAIEGDCVAEKSAALQAAALRAAAAKLDAKSADAPAAAPSPTQAAPVAQQVAGAGAAPGSAGADAKKAQCERFARQLETLRSSQRSGGSAAQMESLNNQRRSIEASQQAAGC